VGYRWVEHTGELELEIEAPTEAAVFADALLAFAELVSDGEPGESVSLELSVPGHDRARLLAEWLDELVFRAETEGVVPVAVERIELGDDELTATVRGVRGNPRPVVKGVTHHRLAFERVRRGFRATVVLDV
jgi:SHS2 domain-containing protein